MMETYYKQLLINEKFITELNPLNKIPVNKGVLMRAIRNAMDNITGSCSLILMKNIFDDLLNLGVITKTCTGDSERYSYSINLNNKKDLDNNDRQHGTLVLCYDIPHCNIRSCKGSDIRYWKNINKPEYRINDKQLIEKIKNIKEFDSYEKDYLTDLCKSNMKENKNE